VAGAITGRGYFQEHAGIAIGRAVLEQGFEVKVHLSSLVKMNGTVRAKISAKIVQTSLCISPPALYPIEFISFHVPVMLYQRRKIITGSSR
jgi:hypothetical protein